MSFKDIPPPMEIVFNIMDEKKRATFWNVICCLSKANSSQVFISTENHGDHERAKEIIFQSEDSISDNYIDSPIPFGQSDLRPLNTPISDNISPNNSPIQDMYNWLKQKIITLDSYSSLKPLLEELEALSEEGRNQALSDSSRFILAQIAIIGTIGDVKEFASFINYVEKISSNSQRTLPSLMTLERHYKSLSNSVEDTTNNDSKANRTKVKKSGKMLSARNLSKVVLFSEFQESDAASMSSNDTVTQIVNVENLVKVRSGLGFHEPLPPIRGSKLGAAEEGGLGEEQQRAGIGEAGGADADANDCATPLNAIS